MGIMFGENNKIDGNDQTYTEPFPSISLPILRIDNPHTCRP